MDIRMLYVTCASPGEARAIAHALVEARLAACCNVLPGMESVYRWQGKLETAQETVLIVKTRDGLVDAATAKIKALHSNSVPCVITINVLDSGNPDYLAWLRAETASA